MVEPVMYSVFKVESLLLISFNAHAVEANGFFFSLRLVVVAVFQIICQNEVPDDVPDRHMQHSQRISQYFVLYHRTVTDVVTGKHFFYKMAY